MPQPRTLPARRFPSTGESRPGDRFPPSTRGRDLPDSALAFHELTTQIPHQVYLAIPRGANPPRLDYPPIRSFSFSKQVFSAGIDTPRLDGLPVRIYSPEKTLADCFKYRNKIGMDTALEAIRLYKERRRIKVDALMRYAELCHVAKIMRPYLEAIL